MDTLLNIEVVRDGKLLLTATYLADPVDPDPTNPPTVRNVDVKLNSLPGMTLNDVAHLLSLALMQVALEKGLGPNIRIDLPSNADEN